MSINRNRSRIRRPTSRSETAHDLERTEPPGRLPPDIPAQRQTRRPRMPRPAAKSSNACATAASSISAPSGSTTSPAIPRSATAHRPSPASTISRPIRQARAVLLRGERRALRPALAALPQPRRSGAADARDEGDRRRHLRPDRPLARPCRGPDHRAGDEPRAARSACARASARTSCATTSLRPQERPLSLVRGDAAVGHPQPGDVPRRQRATIRPCRWSPRTTRASPCPA